jgi:hypothetical protein
MIILTFKYKKINLVTHYYPTQANSKISKFTQYDQILLQLVILSDPIQNILNGSSIVLVKLNTIRPTDTIHVT